MSDLSKRNCTACLNALECPYIHPYKGYYCAAMESGIDHYKHSREPLASDLMGDGYEGFSNRDYKDVLIEGMAFKEETYDMSVEDIRSMPLGSDRETMSKAIMSLLWFGVPKKRILRLLNIGRTLLYEIIKEAKKEYQK